METYLTKAGKTGTYYIDAMDMWVKADEKAANQLVDSRDGKTYRTVKIGTQIWMAENLNYTTSNSWCYDNSPANCDAYGRLYTYDTALTVCPTGWHLPSDAAWRQLFAAVPNTSDLKKGGSSGMDLLPSGYRCPDATFHGVFGDASDNGY